MRASCGCSTLGTSLSRGAVACACLGSWVPSVLGPNLCVFLSAFGGSPFVALPSARSLPQPRGTVPHSHVVAGGVLPTPSGNAYFADAMAASDVHTLSTAEHSDPLVPTYSVRWHPYQVGRKLRAHRRRSLRSRPALQARWSISTLLQTSRRCAFQWENSR